MDFRPQCCMSFPRLVLVIPPSKSLFNIAINTIWIIFKLMGKKSKLQHKNCWSRVIFGHKQFYCEHRRIVSFFDKRWTNIDSYVYWTVYHLDSWIKIDQLDVTSFIISLFTSQHVLNVSTSIFRSLRLIVNLFHVLYCSGSMCVGVTVWFGWGGVVSLRRLKQCVLQPA